MQPSFRPRDGEGTWLDLAGVAGFIEEVPDVAGLMLVVKVSGEIDAAHLGPPLARSCSWHADGGPPLVRARPATRRTRRRRQVDHAVRGGVPGFVDGVPRAEVFQTATSSRSCRRRRSPSSADICSRGRAGCDDGLEINTSQCRGCCGGVQRRWIPGDAAHRGPRALDLVGRQPFRRC